MRALTALWRRAFLAERPSISLSLFRLAAAFTVGAHVIPSLLQMGDNYLATAFRTKNAAFFPVGILRLVEASPDWLVWTMATCFYATLAAFAMGCYAQLSCLLMTAACYYFYALNACHIGTLSFDILLVTLFLMCLTGYHGDFLSVDSVRRGDALAYRRPRPFFIQRLLQLQLAWTFWYTALSKVTLSGNWLTENPYYYLMRYPPMGVVRDFPLRNWLAQQPQVCHWLGIALLAFEAGIPFLWFLHRTRAVGIALGIAFQFMLWGTLQVPTIFLFLFPPMMLLFIAPEHLVGWIETRRAAQAATGRAILLYDGGCGFCLESIRRLRVLDLFGWADLRDANAQPQLTTLHSALTLDRCRSEIVLIEQNGRLSGGFETFRRLCLHLPLLMGFTPLLYLPGAAWMGTRVYRWVALRRDVLHRNLECRTNQCATAGTGASSKTWS